MFIEYSCRIQLKDFALERSHCCISSHRTQEFAIQYICLYPFRGAGCDSEIKSILCMQKILCSRSCVQSLASPSRTLQQCRWKRILSELQENCWHLISQARRAYVLTCSFLYASRNASGGRINQGDGLQHFYHVLCSRTQKQDHWSNLKMNKNCG